MMTTTNESQSPIEQILSTFGDLICCPCGSPVTADTLGESLVCDRCCAQLDLDNGVLSCANWSKDSSPEAIHQLNEQRRRDEQAWYYDVAISMNLASWIERCRIDSLIATSSTRVALEIGCGTGRLTMKLAGRASRVVAIDRSLMSLYHCRAKLLDKKLADRVLLIHCDAASLPLREGVFDLALTTQVLQHIPSRPQRTGTLAELSSRLTGAASLILSVYAWYGRGLLNHKKQGFHKGGIPYCRFTEAELQEMLAPHFNVDSIESCLGQLLIATAHKNEGTNV